MTSADPHPGWYLVFGLGMAGTSIAFMALVRNRFMRRRLLFSLVLAIAFVAVDLARLGLDQFPLLPRYNDIQVIGEIVEVLLASLAVLNWLVTVALNPWFRDGTIDRAPSILQDAIIIAFFGTFALVVFHEQAGVLAGSAIAAAAVGFALQDTLANFFAGLGFQVDRPFRVGQWISVGSFEGVVTAVTWRATKIRTKLGNMVILPNNFIAKEAITNYSEPQIATRLWFDVGADYRVPPNDVRDAITTVLKQTPAVLETPEAEVLLYDFGGSAITYRTRFYISDYNLDEATKDKLRRGVFYEFKRRGIDIPWPIQVQYYRQDTPADSPARRAEFARVIARVPVLAPLVSEVHDALAASAEEQLYGDGEVIVREGDTGASMFIVQEGQVVVTVGPDRKEVARIPTGGYFGEMSLLTGAPRSATVRAHGDCNVLEISADTFRAYVHNHPEVVEHLAAAAETRRRELDRTRSTSSGDAGPGMVSLAHRIREFFGIH